MTKTVRVRIAVAVLDDGRWGAYGYSGEGAEGSKGTAYDVTHYGATGDGTTDDTVAVRRFVADHDWLVLQTDGHCASCDHVDHLYCVLGAYICLPCWAAHKATVVRVRVVEVEEEG